MPARTDIQSILIIGAGPIVIGQACEFDYSGVQACKALQEEGYRLILANSNPATIMTDPQMADAVYIEPVTWQILAEIIKQERPDALLPTMGGQTALNCALDLAKQGVLEQYGVEIIGASCDAIDKAEDRVRFRQTIKKIGLHTPDSIAVHDLNQAAAAQAGIGYPIIIRPSFTLGGSGGGVAYNKDEFFEICKGGLDASPKNEILLEQSLLGWKEYEMEVVRDHKDNCIIICSIENLDPMGIHTGDSITVAPAQTLTDKEYQIMRNASIAILREIGVDTGGSNVQFAVNPDNGDMMIIEMNPRVSRSSALASKATGFPIARVAAKLAVGYTLDELDNQITGGATPASFEPSIDYIVTKVPRFNFEKFSRADDRLTTQMKSIGEVMAIGRTFQESLQKALRSLETEMTGLNEQVDLQQKDAGDTIRRELRVPRAMRIWHVADAFRAGMPIEEVHRLCRIDPWFLAQIKDLVDEEASLGNQDCKSLAPEHLRRLKRKGFSDARLAELLHTSETAMRKLRYRHRTHPVFKRVDSCAAEFPASTAYLYSSYEEECEAEPGARPKIMVLGSGPNRVGQGIEFDYCCVQAAYAIRDAGYETIMVNCNPETVSTDYDTSDRLYFEPLTVEDLLEIIRIENPDGVIVQYGGQTPLKLARPLEAAGVPIIGTATDSIDLAEDRQRFQKLLQELDLRQPPNRIVSNKPQAIKNARQIDYPLVVRPSYVLGGRAMEIIHSEEELADYMDQAVLNDGPILLDRFLEDAIEVDIDAVCDGADVCIAGIMQHIEQAGVHSGDSACCLPPFSLSHDILEELASQVEKMAKRLHVIGLMNAQFAIRNNDIFVLEVNPRASRTIPFVSKAIGVPLARIAVNCMIGISLAEQGITAFPQPDYFSVKESVFPFIKFPGVDPLLGPEMRSTGEVMGIGKTFGAAFARGQLAAGEKIPGSGNVFLSVKDRDKPAAINIAKELSELGYTLCATQGTAQAVNAAGIKCVRVNKVKEGRPHVVDMLKNDEIHLIVNTTEDKQAIADSYSIRRTALQHKVFYTTTMAGANATIQGIRHGNNKQVNCLQKLHAGEIK